MGLPVNQKNIHPGIRPRTAASAENPSPVRRRIAEMRPPSPKNPQPPIARNLHGASFFCAVLTFNFIAFCVDFCGSQSSGITDVGEKSPPTLSVLCVSAASAFSNAFWLRLRRAGPLARFILPSDFRSRQIHPDSLGPAVINGHERKPSLQDTAASRRESTGNAADVRVRCASAKNHQNRFDRFDCGSCRYAVGAAATVQEPCRVVNSPGFVQSARGHLAAKEPFGGLRALSLSKRRREHKRPEHSGASLSLCSLRSFAAIPLPHFGFFYFDRFDSLGRTLTSGNKRKRFLHDTAASRRESTGDAADVHVRCASAKNHQNRFDRFDCGSCRYGVGAAATVQERCRAAYSPGFVQSARGHLAAKKPFGGLRALSLSKRRREHKRPEHSGASLSLCSLRSFAAIPLPHFGFFYFDRFDSLGPTLTSGNKRKRSLHSTAAPRRGPARNAADVRVCRASGKNHQNWFDRFDQVGFTQRSERVASRRFQTTPLEPSVSSARRPAPGFHQNGLIHLDSDRFRVSALRSPVAPFVPWCLCVKPSIRICPFDLAAHSD